MLFSLYLYLFNSFLVDALCWDSWRWDFSHTLHPSLQMWPSPLMDIRCNLMSLFSCGLIHVELFYLFSLVQWPSHKGQWDRQPCTGGNLYRLKWMSLLVLWAVIFFVCTARSMIDSAAGWDVWGLSGCCMLEWGFVIYQDCWSGFPFSTHLPRYTCTYAPIRSLQSTSMPCVFQKQWKSARCSV